MFILMNKIYIYIFSIALFSISCNTSQRDELFIIPQPKESQILNSYFNLDNFHIYADNNSISIAKLLVLEINKLAIKSIEASRTKPWPCVVRIFLKHEQS